MSNDSLLILPPLSLYIHIPWCVKKCPYCDFNSHESNAFDEAAYIRRLEQDLLQDNHWVQGRKLHSIFFGGGTPSLFSADAIAKILNIAEKHIGFETDIEITLEANPGTMESGKFSGFYAAGINRLSIGVQSFQEKHLQKLGRIHNSQEAIGAINSARKSGFTNFNIDLMHGLPEQTIEQANQDLQTAIDLAPTHISWYQLTIEPNTHFYRHPPLLPVEDTLVDIQQSGHQLLSRHGFLQYEISAYSQAGKNSKHNLNYWQFGDYLGIGAGAHGKNTDIKNQQIIRRHKTRLPDHYLNQGESPNYKENSIDKQELPLEFMMNALRLKQGVPIGDYEKRTGLPFDSIKNLLDNLYHKGLMLNNSQQLCTSDRGFVFLNSVLEEFN